MKKFDISPNLSKDDPKYIEINTWIKTAKKHDPKEIKELWKCSVCKKKANFKENGIYYCDKHIH